MWLKGNGVSCYYFDLVPHMAFDSKSTDYRTFKEVLSANLSLVVTLLTQGFSISCYLKHMRNEGTRVKHQNE